jgi:hypothetical protein
VSKRICCDATRSTWAWEAIEALDDSTKSGERLAELKAAPKLLSGSRTKVLPLVSAVSPTRDIEIINRHADRLHAEAEDVLDYQTDL